jgi:hypothetical protein
LIVTLFGTIKSAQLNNNYLPPAGASQAGGQGGGGLGLKPPNVGNSGKLNIAFIVRRR